MCVYACVEKMRIEIWKWMEQKLPVLFDLLLLLLFVLLLFDNLFAMHVEFCAIKFVCEWDVYVEWYRLNEFMCVKDDDKSLVMCVCVCSCYKCLFETMTMALKWKFNPLDRWKIFVFENSIIMLVRTENFLRSSFSPIMHTQFSLVICDINNEWYTSLPISLTLI